MKGQGAIVVIPVYKNKMDVFEKASFDRAIKIFGKERICIVAPDTLINVEVKQSGIKVEYFNRDFFDSQKSYSLLCLSTDFYEHFLEYQYMLIYQLDAFVFEDKLDYFCELGYDYIGAPVYGGDWEKIGVQIGNGGFSLRHIKNTLKLLECRDNIMRKSKYPDLLLMWEDLFFSYCGKNPEIDYMVPPIDEAVSFAFQGRYVGQMRDSRFLKPDEVKNNLPFGTHAWNRFCYDMWYEIISEFGYKIPNPEDVLLWADDENYYYFLENCKYIKLNKNHLNMEPLRELFPDKKARIWGYGEVGRMIEDVLNICGIEIIDIYDKNLCDGRKIKEPNAKSICACKTPLIVTLKYNRAILRTLNTWSFFDYYEYDDVIKKIAIDCIGKMPFSSGTNSLFG